MFSSRATDNRDLVGVIFHVAPRSRESPVPPRPSEKELNLATAKAARAFAPRAVYLHLRSNFHDFISG